MSLTDRREMEADARLRDASRKQAAKWAYEQGFDAYDYPLKDMLPRNEWRQIKNHDDRVKEEVDDCIDKTLDEHLSSYVDGQLRLFAGYTVAENGDTIEEGTYGTWEDLRIALEQGVRDKLRDREQGATFDEIPFV